MRIGADAGGGRVEEDYDPGRRLRRRAVVPVGGTAGSPEPDWVGRRRDVSVEKHFEYSDVNELVRRSDLTGTTEYEYDPRRHLKAKHVNGATEEWKVDVTENYYEAGPGEPARAYNLVQRSALPGGDATVAVHIVRLFPRDERVRFERPIHEQVNTSLERAGIQIIDTDIEFLHAGYADAAVADGKKARNQAIIAEALA